MRKRMAVMLCLLLAAVFVPLVLHTAAAETDSGTCGSDLTWTFDTETGTLTIEGTGRMSYYSGKNYVPWNSYRAQITNVIFSEEQTTISEYSFADCTALTEIRIPDSVVNIYANAFFGCTALASVSFGNRLESIEYQAFANCTSLTSVAFPDSLKTLRRSFTGCTSLASFTLPDGLEIAAKETFADTAWWNAQADGLVYGNGVLWGYKNTCPTSIRVQSGTRLIAGEAFYNCSDIVLLVLPAGLTNICYGAFSGCTGLQSFTMPNGVVNIGESAFRDCTGLTSIVLPNSVNNIGISAFSGCTGLQSVAFPDHLDQIDMFAFSNCTGLTSISLHSVDVINERAFRGCSELISADLGDSVLHMKASVFNGCTKLQTVTLPCSTTVDDNTAFEGCTTIRNLNLTAGDGAMTISIKQVFKDCYQLVEHVQLSEGITSASGYAFMDCTGLTSVTLPNSLVTPGKGMFYGCTNLRYVNIPENAESIPMDMFWRCSSLQEIEIPESVRSIGEYAFYYCENLQDIVIPESVTTIGKSAFIRCSQVSSFEIPSGVRTIEINTFQSCLGMTSFTVHKSLKSVSDSVFYNCTALRDVYYMGTQNERSKNLSIHYNNNDAFINARWHYLNVTGIEWVSLPEKRCYLPDDPFDPTGGRIRITYDNGSTDEEELTADMVEALDGAVSGPQELTVTYEDAQVTLTVYVGHAPGTPQRENEIPATCTDEGGYDEAVYCTVCGEELSREHVVLAALGHDYGEPSYEWTQTENGYAVTASAICAHDASHVLTENGTVRYEILAEPTGTAEGLGRYTATFVHEPFETQTMDVPIPKLVPTVYGDVNGNGKVTSADAAAILRSLVGYGPLSEQGKVNAEVDGDGRVTIWDATMILRYVVDLIDRFPVEPEN